VSAFILNFTEIILMVKKTLKGSLVPIYNAACMRLFCWLLNIRRN